MSRRRDFAAEGGGAMSTADAVAEFDDLDDLRAELVAREREVAEELLGEPNRKLSSRGELRWGSRGSFSLALRGRKRGLCFDHEAGEGGDLLWLIRRQRGGRFEDAVDWARDFLRMPETARRAIRPQVQRATARQTAQADDEPK